MAQSIEDLKAEIARLQSVIERMAKFSIDGETAWHEYTELAERRIDSQAKKIERLRHLLLPFADEASTYDCDEDTDEKKLIPDDHPLMIEEEDGTLTESAIRVRHLRDARTELQDRGV